jgi:COMM domain
MDFITKETLFKSLHLIPLELLKIILKQAYLYCTHYSVSYYWKELYYHGRVLNLSITPLEFELSCKGILALVNWLVLNNPENQGKFTFRNILATHSDLDEEFMNDLEVDYEDLLQTHPGKKIIQTGLQLINVDWRVSVTVSTDTIKNVSIPSIKLLLKLVNPQTGSSFDEVISLDYQTFTSFLRDVRKVNGLLATYN